MAFIGMIAVTILSVIFEGFTFVTLWGWFVASTFHVVTLSIAQGIGLSLTIKFLTQQSNLKKEKEMSFGEAVLTSLASCVVVLLLGLVILMFI